jgi:hypothetical protein
MSKSTRRFVATLQYPLYEQIYGPVYDAWQIEGAPMSEAEKTYFESFLPAGEYEVVPMAA